MSDSLFEINTSIAYNQIVFVEWLTGEQLRTGTQLHGLLEDLREREETPQPELSEFGLDLLTPTTRDEFIAVLNNVASRTCLQYLPILHIEAHGCVNAQGAVTGISPSSEAGSPIIEFSVLAELCRDINLSCRNNLVLIASCCFGAHAIQMAELVTEPAPFYLSIGPPDVVDPADIVDAFIAFYTALFSENSLDSALDAARSVFALERVTTMRLFYEVAVHFIRSISGGAQPAWLQGDVTDAGNPAQQLIASAIADGNMDLTNPHVYRGYFEYFMHHHYVENRSRAPFRPELLAAAIGAASSE